MKMEIFQNSFKSGDFSKRIVENVKTGTYEKDGTVFNRLKWTFVR